MKLKNIESINEFFHKRHHAPEVVNIFKHPVDKYLHDLKKIIMDGIPEITDDFFWKHFILKKETYIYAPSLVLYYISDNGLKRIMEFRNGDPLRLSDFELAKIKKLM